MGYPVDGETPSHRRHRARALAGFYAAGALLSTTAVLLPGWPNMHRTGVALTAVLAAAGALALLALGRHVRRPVCHGFTAAGTVLIAAAQALAGGGSASATYAMLYVWVALHSALFFAPLAVAGHLASTTIAHAGVMLWQGEVPSIAPQLSLTLGTQIAGALVVGSLAARLRRLADTDSLTGLGNRRLVERAMEFTLAHTRRNAQSPPCVALLDLDGFKALNDERGHAAGDRVLIEAAAAWRRLLRPTDTLARTGGDEFTVVLPDCDLDQAEAMVRRLLAQTPTEVSCSAGLARWNAHETPGQLIGRADTALYAAKAEGPLAIARTASHDRQRSPA